MRAAVVDEAIGLRTGIGTYLCTHAIGPHENLIKVHLDVMLVTKRVNFLARLGNRHMPPPAKHLGSNARRHLPFQQQIFFRKPVRVNGPRASCYP